MSRAAARAIWLAGARGEALQLGALHRAIVDPLPRPERDRHVFITTGEQAMPLVQAIDRLGLHPHEAFEPRHPAEDPAIRLHGLMAEIEGEVRRRRADRVIFSGFGATAAAAALVAHARGCRALWVRPPCPLGLHRLQHWESGLTRVVETLADRIDAPPIGRVHDAAPAVAPIEAPPPRDRRPGAPLVLISVGRAIWGYRGVYARLARTAAHWARAIPETDFLIIRNLDARLEGALDSMPDRPANLLAVPPMPYSEYEALLNEARAVLTDSDYVAAEAQSRAIPLIAMTESPPSAPAPPSIDLRFITDAELDSAETESSLRAALERPAKSISIPRPFFQPSQALIRSAVDWIETAAPSG
jgi:hypothetical protein